MNLDKTYDDGIIEVLSEVMIFNPILDSYGKSYIPIHEATIRSWAEKWGINYQDVINAQQDKLRKHIQRMLRNESVWT